MGAGLYLIVLLLSMTGSSYASASRRRRRTAVQERSRRPYPNERSRSVETTAPRRVEEEHDDWSDDDLYKTMGKGHLVDTEAPSMFPAVSTGPPLAQVTSGPTDYATPDSADQADGVSAPSVPTRSPTPAQSLGPIPLQSFIPVLTPGPTFAGPPTRDDTYVLPENGDTPTDGGGSDVSEDRMATVRTKLEETLNARQYGSLDLLSDPSSYQYKALQRIAEQLGVEDFSEAKVTQYWALYCIYFATNGDGSDDDATAGVNNITGSMTISGDNVFTRQEQGNVSSSGASNSQGGVATLISNSSGGWKKKWGWGGSNLDPCRDGWFGVSCDSSSQVTGVRLQRNGLSGVFPFREVVFLASSGIFSVVGAGSLRALEIYSNENLTHDAQSDAWLASLEGLEVLNYRHTGFQGPIPRLPSTLQELDCSYTQHTGSIPEESFQGLDDLYLANLDGNSYHSGVPTVLAALPSLKYLYIRDAKLIGDLSYMQYMPVIVEHAVDKNPDLTGPLFPFIGSMGTLRSFSAADCSLTGSLPVELADGDLVQLWLHGNSLVGSILPEYGDIRDLTILTLEGNDLSGDMPIELCLGRLNGELTTLSADCTDEQVDCSAFFLNCCSCCGRASCGT